MTGPSKTAGKLALVAVLMFGFGYAMVPIYNVLCDVTGINGKTGVISETEAEKTAVDNNRLVTVQFDTNVNGDLPWEFRPITHEIVVHPGKPTDVYFEVENKTGEVITGQAIPSVAPGQAALYFNKTECFCFSQQSLGPNERKQMLVRFVVDPDLPKKISTLTLSYTFFMAPDSAKQAEKELIKNTNKQEI